MLRFLLNWTWRFISVFFSPPSHELNLSVQQSGFTIYRKYKPAPEDLDRVKVGDIIRFYHKEMEAYLVAEGLFDDELLEDGKTADQCLRYSIGF